MTNHWKDIKNADVVLVMGANPAENHPCGFKWALEARDNRGARIVTVDPRTFAVTELLRDDGTSPMQNLSVALEVGRTLWLGPFRGDRVGIVPMPRGR